MHFTCELANRNPPKKTMLELHDLSLNVGTEAEPQMLLSEITASFPRGHLVAVLGPSGCGKSTLLKLIAGIHEPASGSIHWHGRDLANDEDLAPHEVGYVPQFSIAHDYLTVHESIMNALHLRVAGLSADDREDRAERILSETGLDEIGDRLVRVLSGGQKRRLALALEIVSSPKLLLADEVTSGLDPKAEDEIVHLMKQLSRNENCTVISVTHSLRHMALYDSIVILQEGHLAYHGPGSQLAHYFNLENSDELFPRLAMRKAEDWHRSWKKHGEAYTADITEMPLPGDAETVDIRRKKEAEGLGVESTDQGEDFAISETETPGALVQFSVLFARRWKIFFRDRSQFILQLALILGFPCLVVIFALNGLPQIENLSMTPHQNIVQSTLEQARFFQQNSQTGSLVSGLVMFQVILLTLMGQNNAAREIAAERLIFEKEKFAGVRPAAYVASKIAFLGILVLIQSLWMGVFVNAICRFPGDLVAQLVFLIAVNAAMTSICLGISSLMRTAEQASLVSIYLVGFQLPLSGAVLALPKFAQWITQPFIASYWSWSGFLQSMRDTRLYDAVTGITQTSLSNATICFWVLAFHVVLGIFLAYIGCKNSRWE